MAHVGRPSALELSSRRREPRYLHGSTTPTGHSIGTGRWPQQARLSPTNIKTNPNYLGGQRSPVREEKDPSPTKQRPRSLVVLGTSNAANRQRKHHDINNTDHADGNGESEQSQFHATPRQRGLSNPDITQKFGRDIPVIKPRRPRGRSASDILDDDLDLPEYKRGLSSPDLGQGQERKLKKAKGKSVSLGVLRRSHDCLKPGVNGECKCTVPLYKPESSADLTKIPPMRSGSVDQGIGMVGRPASQLHRHGSKNISDSDVSSFFAPSQTAWKHGSKRKQDQSQSVDTDLNTRSTPMYPLRPASNPTEKKPLQRRGDLTPKENKDPEMSKVKRSTSLPSASAWQTNISPSGNANIFYAKQPPPKPPRFNPESMRRKPIAERREPGTFSRISAPPLSRPLSMQNRRPSFSRDEVKHTTPSTNNNNNNPDRTMSFRETFMSLPAERESPQDSSHQPKYSAYQNADPEAVKYTSPAQTTPRSPISYNTPVALAPSLPSACTSMGDETPNPIASTSSEVPEPSPRAKNLDYKPLYHEMIDPSKRWFTSFDRDRGSVASTYFAAREPGLGRDLSSYKYSNKEDKAKVLALLDRYASSGRSGLGLSREQMTNYLNCTKRQLGINGSTDLQTDQSDDKLLGKEEDGKIKFYPKIEPPNTNDQEQPFPGDVSDKENINPNNNNINTEKEIDHDSEQPKHSTPKLSSNKENRGPSIVPLTVSNTRMAPSTRTPPSKTPLKPKMVNLFKDKDKRYTKSFGDDGSEILVLPQTTFHVDGDITDTPAVRRRTLLSQPNSLDDINNNDDVKGTRVKHVQGEALRKAGRPASGEAVYSIDVPCYQMWRAVGAIQEENIPQELLTHGMTMDVYQQVCPLLNHSIQCDQLSANLQMWLGGTYMAITFLLMLLLGVVVAYIMGVTPFSGAVLVLILCILVLCGVVWAIKSTKNKVRENLRVTLMRVNTLLSEDNMAAFIVEKRFNIQGTTLHLVHFDTKHCQNRLSDVLADKRREDLLLTEISREYGSLMELITGDLRYISHSQDDLGKQVIVNDVLMYFVSPYLNDFLLQTKKSASSGNNKNISHPQSCICQFVGCKFDGKLYPEAKRSQTLGAEGKLPSSKPTLL